MLTTSPHAVATVGLHAPTALAPADLDGDDIRDLLQQNLAELKETGIAERMGVSRQVYDGQPEVQHPGVPWVFGMAVHSSDFGKAHHAGCITR